MIINDNWINEMHKTHKFTNGLYADKVQIKIRENYIELRKRIRSLCKPYLDTIDSDYDMFCEDMTQELQYNILTDVDEFDKYDMFYNRLDADYQEYIDNEEFPEQFIEQLFRYFVLYNKCIDMIKTFKPFA